MLHRLVILVNCAEYVVLGKSIVTEEVICNLLGDFVFHFEEWMLSDACFWELKCIAASMKIQKFLS